MPIELDMTLTWKTIERRLEQTTSPRQRAMLENVITHMKAEAHGDLDTLLGSLNPNPRYHFWSDRGDTGPKGMDEVRAYYTDLVSQSSGLIESVKHRVVVDDYNVVHEGVTRWVVQGRFARWMGWEVPEEDSEVAHLVTLRGVTLWGFDDQARALGEDGYSVRVAIQKLEEHEWPEQYRATVAANAAN